MSLNVEITVRKGDIEGSLRHFKKEVTKNGVIAEIYKRVYFTSKKQELRRKAKLKAEKRETAKTKLKRR